MTTCGSRKVVQLVPLRQLPVRGTHPGPPVPIAAEWLGRRPGGLNPAPGSPRTPVDGAPRPDRKNLHGLVGEPVDHPERAAAS